MKRIALVLIVLVTLAALASAEPPKYPQRWVYLSHHLRSDASAAKAAAVLKDFKAAGGTHVLFVATRGHRLPKEKPSYTARVRRFQGLAGKLGLKIAIPSVSTGYCGRYLDVDSNLVAGIPVKKMAFIVKGKTAEPDPAGALNISKLKVGRGSVLSGKLKARPFMWYRIRFEIVPVGDARVRAYVSVSSGSGKRRHTRTDPMYKKTPGGGMIYETVFNSLEADLLSVSVNAGKHKIKDLRIEPAGMLLIVRRKRIPLTVTSADGKTTYEEGRDFNPVADPIVARRPFPGEFPFNHPAPPLVLTENSRIKDGQKLLVSFWHHQRIHTDQDNLSLQEPRVWPILEKEMTQMQGLWKPDGIMLNYDEIRVGMWEPPEPGDEKLTPGQFLARHFKRSYDMARRIAPQATVYTWSDMFTPHHNARPVTKSGYYYLVNGNWDGAWEGVPKDVVILNWYAPTPESVKYFADRGHAQVLCGYYDKRNTAGLKTNIHMWEAFSAGVPNVRGHMYTTWGRRYQFLKEYYQLLDTWEKWKADMPAPRRR